MNGVGTIIVVAGLGFAAFLYFRSQQQQSAALASAAATPPPNILERAYNTVAPRVSGAVQATGTAVGATFRLPLSTAGGVASGLAGGANEFVSAVRSIF